MTQGRTTTHATATPYMRGMTRMACASLLSDGVFLELNALCTMSKTYSVSTTSSITCETATTPTRAAESRVRREEKTERHAARSIPGTGT